MPSFMAGENLHAFAPLNNIMSGMRVGPLTSRIAFDTAIRSNDQLHAVVNDRLPFPCKEHGWRQRRIQHDWRLYVRIDGRVDRR